MSELCSDVLFVHKMKYEEIFDHIGQLRTFQICICINFFLFATGCVEVVTLIFAGAEMPHWCHVPELANYSFERQKLIAIPEDDTGTDYSSCELYSLNYSTFSESDFRNWNRSVMITEDTPRRRCSAWVYDQSIFVSTIVKTVRGTFI